MNDDSKTIMKEEVETDTNRILREIQDRIRTAQTIEQKLESINNEMFGIGIPESSALKTEEPSGQIEIIMRALSELDYTLSNVRESVCRLERL